MQNSVNLVGPVERALFLRTLNALDALEPADVAVFAEHICEEHHSAGDQVVHPDQEVDAFHVIVDGSVRAVGGEFPVPVELGVREGFGFLPMLSRQEESLDVVALEDTVLLSLDADHFVDILESSFPAFLNSLRNLARALLFERKRTPIGTDLAPARGFLRKSPGDSVNLVERLVMSRRPGSPFESSGLGALTSIVAAAEEVRFAAGEEIWHCGDPSPMTYIIVAGDVACRDAEGNPLFRAGPGYPLGNLERLTAEPRWYAAIAETDVLLLRGDTEAFFDVLEDHFDMAISMIRSMAENLLSLRRAAAQRGLEVMPLLYHESGVEGDA